MELLIAPLMELKLLFPSNNSTRQILLIAPLMELKLICHSLNESPEYSAFNRTAYGIETYKEVQP